MLNSDPILAGKLILEQALQALPAFATAWLRHPQVLLLCKGAESSVLDICTTGALSCPLLAPRPRLKDSVKAVPNPCDMKALYNIGLWDVMRVLPWATPLDPHNISRMSGCDQVSCWWLCCWGFEDIGVCHERGLWGRLRKVERTNYNLWPANRTIMLQSFGNWPNITQAITILYSSIQLETVSREDKLVLKKKIKFPSSRKSWDYLIYFFRAPIH